MQSIPVAIIILIIGFVFLIKGADLFVEGSSSVAKRLKVPSVIIGLTIVAMGTSLPETAVSVSASIQGNNTLAISNAIGSNIFNLMVVIGVCAIMTAIPVDRSTNKRDFPISIVSAVILLLLGIISMVLGRVDGIILLVLFCIYIFLTIREAINIRKQNKDIIISESVEEAEEIKILPVGRCVLYILIGMIGIVLGGDLVVQSATVIATGIGISQTLIGLTIVSVGTSLPELVTSVVAAKKKEIGMALGNAIGSNIFNILMILGIAGTLSPIAVITENIIDIVVLIVFSIIVWGISVFKKRINRGTGIFMVICYFIYMVYICIR